MTLLVNRKAILSALELVFKHKQWRLCQKKRVSKAEMTQQQMQWISSRWLFWRPKLAKRVEREGTEGSPPYGIQLSLKPMNQHNETVSTLNSYTHTHTRHIPKASTFNQMLRNRGKDRLFPFKHLQDCRERHTWISTDAHCGHEHRCPHGAQDWAQGGTKTQQNFLHTGHSATGM